MAYCQHIWVFDQNFSKKSNALGVCLGNETDKYLENMKNLDKIFFLHVPLSYVMNMLGLITTHCTNVSLNDPGKKYKQLLLIFNEYSLTPIKRPPPIDDERFLLFLSLFSVQQECNKRSLALSSTSSDRQESKIESNH